MNNRYIIYCALRGDDWKEKQARHLMPIGQNPLIAETAKKIHSIDKDAEIYTVMEKSQPVNIHYCKLVQVIKNEKYGTIDSFITTSDLWNKEGKTICVMGDTYFSENAISTIASNTDKGTIFFGRKGWHKLGVTNRNSIFGYSFDKDSHDTLKESMMNTVNNSENIGTLKIKDIMRECKTSKWVTIDDMTQDLDIVNDYRVLMNTLELVKR